MAVRAKFRVARIERSLTGGFYNEETKKHESREVQTIVLYPVVNDGDAENKKFFAATPSGELKLGMVNAETAAQFDLNKAYYLDMSPAE